MLFKNDQKLTIISISDFMATTVKREIRITRTVNGRAAYSVKGKRKEYYFDLKPDMIVLDGWSVPLKVDTETNDFHGNGCYNFVVRASVGNLKELLSTKNINETFNRWDNITYILEKIGGFPLQLFNHHEIEQLNHGSKKL